MSATHNGQGYFNNIHYLIKFVKSFAIFLKNKIYNVGKLNLDKYPLIWYIFIWSITAVCFQTAVFDIMLRGDFKNGKNQNKYKFPL